MSWITKLFSSNVTALVDSVGSTIDKLVTSDEERDQLKIQMKAEINKLAKSQIDAMQRYDAEISTRHSSDMKSDSWLSKNVRPLSLIFLTASTVLLAFLSIFILDVEEVALVEPWKDLLQILLVTVYAFYFGSRGMEKVTSIRSKTNQ